MTHLDFDRSARAWLDDGPTQIGDRALQAALDEIHLTAQRRPRWAAWRTFPVSNLSRSAALAAVVIAVGAGMVYLGRDMGGGGPLPPPSASASPAPSSSPPAPTTGQITLTWSPESLYRVHVAAGPDWTSFNRSVIQKHGGAPPSGMAVAVWEVGNVYEDGCDWADALMDPPVGPTVDDLANAIAALDDRRVTTPLDVNVSGFSGKALEMTLPDVDFASCDQGEFRSWLGPDGDARYHQGPREHSRILILDVNGSRTLIFGRSFPGTSSADLTELNRILDTMQIEALAPRASSSATP